MKTMENNLQKMIVWLVVQGKKKVTYNQFHVQAKDINTAINICKEEAKKEGFDVKIMGVGGYEKVGVDSSKFINKKFY